MKFCFISFIVFALQAMYENKNIRKLTVDGLEYYWKVEDDTRDYQGLIVTVGMVLKPYKRLVFDFRFDYEKIKTSSETSKRSLTGVTPKLITEAITFAYQNYNWGGNPTCAFKFESGVFQGKNEESI